MIFKIKCYSFIFVRTAQILHPIKKINAPISHLFFSWRLKNPKIILKIYICKKMMRFLHSIDILIQFSLNAYKWQGRNITLKQIKNFNDKHLCTLNLIFQAVQVLKKKKNHGLLSYCL